MEFGVSPFVDDLPELDPVIAHEQTSYGWRGLTEHGEVLEVKTNGHCSGVPDSIMVVVDGRPIGRRSVTNQVGIDIGGYLLHFNRVVELYRANKLSEALEESEATLRAAPTLRARFNRSMVSLAAGKWSEGLSEYWEVEQRDPFMRPQVKHALSLGLRPWRGEDLEGNRLLLLHAHGFGDTIMCLRFVRELNSSVMVMPPELMGLANQVGRVIPNVIGQVGGDFFCPMLHLLHARGITPERVSGESYLNAGADLKLVNKWHVRLTSRRKKIGLAWSIGKPSPGDYPREIDVGVLAEWLGGDGELHSVQSQDHERARECGVITHEFEDFADCAAMMRCMDEIISVDTAALHLAGAIGHPKVYGLLSRWASWRWLANWYDNVTLLRQTVDGDWTSALAQR
jgi:hypothetical protein